MKIQGVEFSGAQIAIVLGFISTIGGGIWTASSVYSRLEAVEAYEIPDTAPLYEDIAVMKQELEDNDVAGLQGKLATFSTNLKTILEQQQKLLTIQERMVDIEKEMEAMKGVVQRAELKTKELEDFEKEATALKREIQQLWEGMDYLSNPLQQEKAMPYHTGKKKKPKKKGGKKRKAAPKGYHYMPNGKLMKDSAHKGRKKRRKK